MATKNPQVQDLGTNVTGTMDGDILILRIDTNKRYGESKSGKSETIATTSGNVKVSTPKGEITMGLNVYKKKA